MGNTNYDQLLQDQFITPIFCVAYDGTQQSPIIASHDADAQNYVENNEATCQQAMRSGSKNGYRAITPYTDTFLKKLKTLKKF